MSNRKPAGPATKSKNRRLFQVALVTTLCCLALVAQALPQIVENPITGHRYEYVRLRGFFYWDQAQEMAVSRGGYLATVTDSIESQLVSGLLAFPGQKAFLGATDYLNSCMWTWVTGEPWTYQNWAPGEPGGEEPCINSLRISFELNGAWEADVGPLDGFIVEWNVPTNDTLLNLKQWPLFEGGTGHWYAVIPQWTSWDYADSLAKRFRYDGEFGHLVTITSPEENQFILNNILVNAWPDSIFFMKTEYWLGGELRSGAGWEWVTGEPFTYTNWFDTIPIGQDGRQVAVMVGHGFDVNPPLPGQWLQVKPGCDPGTTGCHWAVIEFDTHAGTVLENLVQWPVSEGGNGHWYAYLPRNLSWDRARYLAAQVERNGVAGHLASISSQAENDFIFNNLLSINNLGRSGPHWLGGFYDDLWKWITGEPFFYANWAYGFPVYTDTSMAVTMLGPPNLGCVNCPNPGEWISSPANQTFGSIVEFDTESDTGLVSLMQWPVSEGGNGHWYAYLPAKLTWEQARLAARQFTHDGVTGHLATITSPQENDFAFRTVSFDPANPMGRVGHHWLGGFDDSLWVWVTGEPMIYTNWAIGQPSPIFYGAAAMVGPPWMECALCPQPGEWFAHQRDTALGSIVEFDTEPIEPRVLRVPEEYPTIQLAIDTALTGDIVLVSPGVYEESINFLGKSIAVRSAEGPMHTVITNHRTANLVTFDHGETSRTRLDGFTLMGGWMAILCVGSSPVITHNICVGQNVWNWAAIGLCGSYIDVGDPSGDPRISARVGPAPAALINNTIVMSANGGISSFSSEPPSFRNNIVAFNTNYGIHQQDPFSQPQPILGYNDVFGNGVDSPYPYGDYINIPDPGLGSICADPLFSPDFSPTWTLTAESPCIDAGDPNARFNDPDSSRNDMGALPFMGGPGGGVIPTNQWVVVYCSGLDSLIITEPGSASILQAFDPSGVLCGQTLVWLDRSYLMPVYGDDPYTDIDEGCVSGDLIQFQIDGMPVQPASPVYWTNNGDTFEVCDFGYAHCLNIPLHTGWNLVSWNVAYEAPIRLALDEIIGCVDVVVSFEQGGLVFDPTLDGFNTLTYVDHHHGYWIRMNCDAMLQVCGDPIGPDQAIGLELGWNLVSYWPELPLPTETGFVTILDHLEEAMGFDNGAQIWLPGLGHLNTLTELRPAFGYWVKVDAPHSLTYPPFGGGLDPDDFIGPVDSGLTSSPPTETSRNWMSAYGDNITVDGEPLSDGAVLSFCTDESIVCGRGVYQSGALRFTPVYGRDQSGDVSKSYPVEGDVLAVYVNDQRVYPDVTWSSDGARVRLSRLTTDSRGLPQEFELAQNYPNPFNPGTMVAFEVPVDGRVNIAIFNVLGQQVRTLTNRDYVVGRYELEWNGRDDGGELVASGVYFYRLTAGETVLTKKMMLLK